MNLVKLFTRHGSIYVDSDELARGRQLLRIYTSQGNRLAHVGKTRAIREKASFGVHADNLFASAELALINAQRIERLILTSQGDHHVE